MATLRRRSSRLHGNTPQRSTANAMPSTGLSSLMEREETPEHERTNLASAMSSRSTTTLIPVLGTPSARQRVKPDPEEMHPARFHHSTKKLSSAKRLGLLNTDNLVSSDGNKQIASSNPNTTSNPFSSPTFEFKFKRPSTEMSTEAQRMMEELRETASRYKVQMAAARQDEQPDETLEESNGRKFANAKGRMGRYSDVHMREFKKMNSIANHPSSFRADPSHHISTPKSLKRTNSKIALDIPSTPKNLKRSNSKANLGAASAPQPQVSKATPNQPQSMKRMASIKSISDDSGSIESTSRAKRIKQQHSSTPLGHQSAVDAKAASSTHVTDRTRSALMTPTKASLSRSASVKSFKINPSEITAMTSSPSAMMLMTPQQPSRIARPQTTGGNRIRASIANRYGQVKSILRRPQIRFSDDPIKIAAGTHVATLNNVKKGLLTLPGMVPGTPSHRMEKHVNFSPRPDTIFHFATSQQSASPSPVKAEKDSKRSLATTAHRASVPDASPTRGISKGLASGDFTFRADKSISFSPRPVQPLTPTIRHVHASDSSEVNATIKKLDDLPHVPHGLSNKKRKRDPADTGSKDETQDKENMPFQDLQAQNDNIVVADGSPQKRAKIMKPVDAPKSVGKLTKPSSTAKGARGKGFLSLSRLNALSKPKHR